MIQCIHQFITIFSQEYTKGGVNSYNFVVIICAFCGQKRHITSYPNELSLVHIVDNGGIVTMHATITTTNNTTGKE